MDATVILTYRGDATGDRHANLLAVLGWLAKTPDHEVIVVEQDTLPSLGHELPHPRCRTVFAYNPGPFNKAWGFNIGARMAKSGVLVFNDADVIIDGGLGRSIALCRNSYHVVKPYRRLIDLTADETTQVRAGHHDFIPERTSDALPNRAGISEVIVICGGLFLIRKDAFAFLGGWDERFRGWGGEDDALTYRLQRARLSTVELDERPALHLWHPRSPDTTSGQPFYASNCDLLASYRGYSNEVISRLSEIQLQTMGNTEKYRPAA